MSSVKESQQQHTVSGPSAIAPWGRRSAVAQAPAATWITLPDAADSTVAYFLAEKLAPVQGADGYPVLSIVLLLSGVPDPGEANIADRVRQGTVAFDVMLGLLLPPLAEGERELRPIFTRTVLVELLSRDMRVLASGSGTGTTARVGLAATLERDDILAVIGSLDGHDTGLSLKATVTFRATQAQKTVYLSGRWCDVHDALAQRYDALEILSPDTLSAAYSELIATGVLTLSDHDEAAVMYPSFASSARVVILDEAGRLLGRPLESFAIDLAHKGATTSDRSVTFTGSLESTLGGTLDGLDRDRVISLVSIGASGGQGASHGIAPTPRRVRSVPESRTRSNGEDRLRLGMTGTDKLATPSRMLATSAIQLQNPHRLLSQSVDHRLLADNSGKIAQINNDVVASPSTPTLPGPIVDSDTSLVFADRSDASFVWYVPSFEVIAPALSDDATTSPFVFSFARVGVRANGEPAIDATVTLRMRQVMGPEVTADLTARGNPSARPIATDNATIEFNLPFRDDAHVARSQQFPATFTRAGDVLTVTVQLIDAWARLCYGALSVPGLQTQPAALSVAWTYFGYVRLPPGKIHVVYGAKAALTHVVYAKERAAPMRGAYLDAATATYRSPIGDYALKIPPDSSAISRPMVVPQPALEILPGWWREPVFVQRTFVRSQAISVMFPCVDFGACYVERRPEGAVAIGCQDALRLGQTAWRQHEEVMALADPLYRVYRSLQQPGRFLVLPVAYRISRYPATAGENAYRPLILLYAVIDPEQELSNHVVIDACLQPDISPCAVARLRARLNTYAHDPVVVFPTEVECTPTFDWGLADIPTVTIAATLQPDAMSVSLGADLAHALLLRGLLSHTGITGTVTFTFPDASTPLSSSIQINLGALTGPFVGGPVEISITGDQATLTNRIERPVVISDLFFGEGVPDLAHVAVEAELASRAATTVTVPVGTTTAWAATTLPPAPPAALEEVRAFVEDIRTNVIFLDLIDHASHDLLRLDVQARLTGVPGTELVAMTGSPAVGTASFILPLTSYLSQHVVQYQATATKTDGTETSGSWVDWDFDADGRLVSLTWDALGLPATH